MRDYVIAELSQWAGLGVDGYVWGGVDPSPYTRVLSDVRLAGTVYAVRKDAGTGNTFTDVSAEAVSEVANSFPPWGSTAAFSSGDKLYIACTAPIAKLFVDIDTPGVWTGDGLEVRYSSNSLYDDKIIAGVVDGSNGFRNVDGIYSISIPWPSDITAFSPQPGSQADIDAGRAVASRTWLVLVPKNLTAVTAAPLLRRIWIEHVDSSVSYLDLTSGANAAVSPAPAENTASFFPVVGSAVYYVTPTAAYAEDRYVFKAQAATRTRKLQYLAGDGTWKDLAVIDPSNDFTSGPAAYSTIPTQFLTSWNIPSDWTSQTKTFGTVTETGFWRRVLTTAVSPLGPMLPVTTVVRARRFGAGGVRGLSENATITLFRFKLSHIGSRAGGAVVGVVRNMHTGVSASFTIPDPYAIGAYVALSTALTVEAGQQWDIFWTSGGCLYDFMAHFE